MKHMKKTVMALALVLLVGSLTACGDEKEAQTATTEETTEQTSTMPMTEVTKADHIEGFVQTAAPEEGDTIATISVEGFGDIVVRFFDEIAPYGVENFVTHAKEGYYDGLKFHRVINDFMIQGGDPNGTGTGGESIWGESFYNEISDQACIIRGSLCYANSATENSNGSQFFITQAAEVKEEDLASYEEYGYTFTEEQKEAYLEYGGCPWLQGGYTVFGQVVEGMDVVDAIAAVEVEADESSSIPKEDVIISSITVSTYSAE